MSEMSLNKHELKDKLLSSLDKVIQEGHWDQGLFSRNILKRLQALRQKVLDILEDESDALSSDPKASQKLPEMKPGYRRVYVAVYQAEGEHMERWLHLIKNLADFSASRPVYGEEEHVQELMRAKRSRNDAYVVLWMKEQDVVLPLAGGSSVDRFQHALYAVKPSGVKPENLIEFVHDGKRYIFHDGQLVLKERE